MMKNWKTRLASILLLLATAWYLPWMFANLNWAAPWLALPFAAASVMTALMALITALNHWHSEEPERRPVPVGQEPEIAIIIPTYGERTSMVYETAKSVLEQNYPQDMGQVF